MGSAALPFDFGEFSPRSLGVTVNLPQTLGRLYPVVGAGMLSGDGAASTSYFSEWLGREVEEDARFTILGYSSCISHELRHYHDYLATPFGAASMGNHILAARYVVPSVLALADEPAIGVPLQSWESLSPRLHEAYRARVRGGKFSEKPPEPLRRITASADTLLKRVRQLHGRSGRFPDLNIEARDLLESNAVTIQLEQIEALFGRDRSIEFARHLNDMAGAESYTRVFSLFHHIANELVPGSYLSAAVMNAIVFFALCGTNAEGEEWPHPSDRLMGVLGYLQASRDYPTDDNILDILDHVASKVCHTKTLEESLRASADSQEKLAAALEELARRDGSKLSDGKLVKAYQGWARAHRDAVETLLANPMAYFDPKRYLENLSLWPAAPVFLGGTRSAGTSELPLMELLKKRGWSMIWGFGDLAESETEISRIGLMLSPGFTPGRETLALDDAVYLSQNIWVAYLLWSPDMMNSTHRTVGAGILKSIRPEWEVLLL